MFNDQVIANPFPGLRAFEEEEDILFFGREKQVDELLRKLRTSRFLAIIGSSGSGKSSLVKSGLLPSLHSGLMSGAGSRWRIALFRPGNDPIGELNKALSKEGVLRDGMSADDQETYTAINESILHRSNLGLVEVYRQSGLDKRNNLLVLVDQFEEIFRFSKYEKEEGDGKRDSIAFINLLLKASEQKEFPIYVVFTMRSDFLGDCTEFRGLPEAINEGQYLVPRMTREERREAITGPIAVGNGDISPALLNRLLNDVGDNPDQLPILQHAMMRTWDEWKEHKPAGKPLDIDDYENIGTITEALSQHAEEAYSELTTDKERKLCEIIFKELTDKGGLAYGIRRPRMLSELCAAADATPAEVIKVIEVFRKPGRGFLMPAYPAPLNEKSIIDISHESLMRVWKRLITWLEEEEESAQVYLHLCEAVNLYESGKGGLWRDPELQIAIKWKEEQNTNAAWASRYNNYYDKVIFFLEHSRQQRDLEIKHKEEQQKQRLRVTRRVSVVVSVIALLAFMLSIYAFQKKNEANKAKADALTEKQKAIDQGKIAEQNKTRALYQEALALQAKDSAGKSEAYAIAQKQIALNQENIARQESINAKKAEQEAKQSAQAALTAESAAEESEKKAEQNREEAEKNRLQALNQKKEAERLQKLAEAKNDAHQAMLFLNEKDYRECHDYAINAYNNNTANNGSFQDNDIYNALYLSWENTIGDKNDIIFHNAPVRAIVGYSKSDIVFSGDEEGVIITSQYNAGILKSRSSVNVGSGVRALAVSPMGDYLVAVLLQQAVVLKINADKSLTEYTRVNFTGNGKHGVFLNPKYFLVQSSEGVSRFEIKNLPQTGAFKKVADCNALIAGPKGNLFISSGKYVEEYKSWDIFEDGQAPFQSFQLPSTVTSISTDESGRYLAAGTYDGEIWLKDLTGGQKPFIAALHHSAINDLKFSNVADGALQLASAGSDKTVKLFEVITSPPAALNTQDMITIQEHSQWVYTLYYTPDNKYLFSGSEDHSIIGSPTTMEVAYNNLMGKK